MVLSCTCLGPIYSAYLSHTIYFCHASDIVAEYITFNTMTRIGRELNQRRADALLDTLVSLFCIRFKSLTHYLDISTIFFRPEVQFRLFLVVLNLLGCTGKDRVKYFNIENMIDYIKFIKKNS